MNATPKEVAVAVEAHIAECTKAGKQPSKSEIAWMRSWPEQVAAGDPHPWYGPCDGLGSDDECSECERVSALRGDREAGCYVEGLCGD